MDIARITEKDLNLYPQYYKGFDCLVKYSEIEKQSKELAHYKKYTQHYKHCYITVGLSKNCTCGLDKLLGVK